jgi:hypothetical protein
MSFLYLGDEEIGSYEGNRCGICKFLGSIEPRRLKNRNKEGSDDPNLPANSDDLLKGPGWKETTHPEAGKKGHLIQIKKINMMNI